MAELASRLRLVVARLNRQLRRQADIDLPPTRLAHLSTIEREGPLTLGELATAEGVAPATVTKVVNHLETLGFAERVPDPADKRVTRVHVTAEGARQLHATRTRKTAWLARQLADLDTCDAAALVDAISVLESLADRPSD